jgi:hypothetical protein
VLKSALASKDSANTAERRTLALNIVFFIIGKTSLIFYINIVNGMEPKH